MRRLRSLDARLKRRQGSAASAAVAALAEEDLRRNFTETPADVEHTPAIYLEPPPVVDDLPSTLRIADLATPPGLRGEVAPLGGASMASPLPEPNGVTAPNETSPPCATGPGDVQADESWIANRASVDGDRAASAPSRKQDPVHLAQRVASRSSFASSASASSSERPRRSTANAIRRGSSSSDGGPFEISGAPRPSTDNASVDEGPFEVDDVASYSDATAVDDPNDKAWLMLQQQIPDEWELGSMTHELLKARADSPETEGATDMLPPDLPSPPQAAPEAGDRPRPQSAEHFSSTDLRMLPPKAEGGRGGLPKPRIAFRTRSDRGYEPQKKVGRFRSKRRQRSLGHQWSRLRRDESPDEPVPAKSPPPPHAPGAAGQFTGLQLARDAETVLRALKEAERSAERAERTLLAVARFALAPAPPAHFAARRDALLKAGAAGALVAAVSAHARSAPVQAMGAWAVTVLAEADALLRAALGDAGAVAAAAGMLRAHPDSRWTLEFALRALAALAAAATNRDRMEGCGALDAAVAAMARHMDRAVVQADGAGLLARAAQSHAGNARRVAANDGVDAVVAAMRGFRTDAAVQMAGCLALRHAADAAGADVQAVAAKKGAVQVLLAALAAHADSPPVVAQAAPALARVVAGVVANAERVANAPGGPAVLAETVRGPDATPTVQAELLGVLAEAAAARPDKAPEFVQAGLLDVALGCMRTHAGSIIGRPVMQAAARAARAILATGSPEAEAGLKAAGGVGVLLELLSRMVAEGADAKVGSVEAAGSSSAGDAKSSIPSEGSPVSAAPEPSEEGDGEAGAGRRRQDPPGTPGTPERAKMLAQGAPSLVELEEMERRRASAAKPDRAIALGQGVPSLIEMADMERRRASATRPGANRAVALGQGMPSLIEMEDMERRRASAVPPDRAPLQRGEGANVHLAAWS